MGVFSFFRRRAVDKALPSQIISKSQIMVELHAVVADLETFGFKSRGYVANGSTILTFRPSCSKLSTLSNERLFLGGVVDKAAAAQAVSRGMFSCDLVPAIPTYHLLGMVVPDKGDGRQWWYGGGWVLRRGDERGNQSEIISVNVGKDMNRVLPRDVEIEGLIQKKVPVVGAVGTSLESIGRFTLDILDEPTSRSILSTITHKYAAMFPQANAG